MKDKLVKNKSARRNRKIRIMGITASLLMISSIAVFVPLINSSTEVNNQLEMEIHNIDNDITRLNNQLKDLVEE